jgi:hypothetical protein
MLHIENEMLPKRNYVYNDLPCFFVCTQVNSQLISNVCIDALSAEKVWSLTSSRIHMNRFSFDFWSTFSDWVFFSSITISFVLWDARHHMLLWNALFSPIQIWYVLMSIYFWPIVALCNCLMLTNYSLLLLYAGNSWWGGCSIKAYPFWNFTKDFWCRSG